MMFKEILFPNSAYYQQPTICLFHVYIKIKKLIFGSEKHVFVCNPSD